MWSLSRTVRVFDGARYTLHAVTKSKREAIRLAKNARSDRLKARVVAGNGQWGVFTRKK